MLGFVHYVDQIHDCACPLDGCDTLFIFGLVICSLYLNLLPRKSSTNNLFEKGLQLEEAERRLHDSQSKLARLRSQSNAVPIKGSLDNARKDVKVERRSTSPIHINGGSSRNQSQSKPELLIPAVNPKLSQPIKSSNISKTQYKSATKAKGGGPSRVSFEPEVVEIQDKGTKRKLGEIFLLNGFALIVSHFVTVHI